MPTYRTPDVYVEEIPVFPPSVAEVETAVPAFIGYTEKAQRTSPDDLLLAPTRIYSLKEYESFFGGPPADTITVQVDGAAIAVAEPITSALLAYSVQMFYANGGGKCWIVSVGTYGTGANPAIDGAELKKGLDAVAKVDEPTLLVIPEAVWSPAALAAAAAVHAADADDQAAVEAAKEAADSAEAVAYAEYKSVVEAMLAQCGALRDRFAILDVFNGFEALDGDVVVIPKNPPVAEQRLPVIEASREAWIGNLKYGAAYYPFIRTTINPFVDPQETNVKVTVGADLEAALATFEISNTAVYNAVKAALKERFVVLPPSGAVAGVYAAVDTARGVWKAPANVALAGVLEPVVKLDTARQDGLNVDATSGKSVNVLRAFSGRGTLVWGARTLAGNDNEWRYVPVRRFFNMVEESVKKATSWAVFEANDANTWVKVRGMIENYLLQKWREGALAGATPKDAFFVRCGLGTTMSVQDILEGRMHVELGLAVVRPAEFIVLKFSHKLQTS
jgi:uncharacterized protein